MNNLHIGGSVMKAAELIEKQLPNVQYMYYLQHDFSFIEDVDHTALVSAMKQHDELNYVRFQYKAEGPRSTHCGNATHILVNATKKYFWEEASNFTLVTTSKYSDNNHFVKFRWYKELIASLVMLRRPPEAPLMSRALDGCAKNQSLGLYLYPDIVLEHLDGRHSLAVNVTQQLGL